MAPIVSSIDIDRPRDEVFVYVTDPSTFAEWQAGVVGGSTEGGKPPSVGSKCTTTRRIGGNSREVTSEITKIDPPSSWAVRGIDGPIRAIVNVNVEPLNGGAPSRVTIELDFEGHGIGKLLVPLVLRRQAPQRDARALRQAQATTRDDAKPVEPQASMSRTRSQNVATTLFPPHAGDTDSSREACARDGLVRSSWPRATMLASF